MDKQMIPTAETPRTIDFTVREDFVAKLPQILSNVEEVKKWAEALTAADKVAVLETEEDFDNAKKRCAEINRVVENIERKRKDVKKAYSEPYALFEERLKEVTTLLKDARGNLWSQVATAENAKKERKNEEIATYYNNTAPEEIKKLKPYAQIFKPEWLNKGKRMESILSEIDAKIEILQAEVDAVYGLHSPHTAALLDLYEQGTQLAAIIKANERLAAIDAENSAEKQIKTKEDTETKNAAETPKETDEAGQITIDFRVTGTHEQIVALKTFLKENKIKYGRVE